MSGPPDGITIVTKNDFFTYIKADKGDAHRSSVQVWNVSSEAWSFQIYTGGDYQFPGPNGTLKKETNTFHKKHLVTLSGTATIGDKAKSILTKRTSAFEATAQTRQKRATDYVSSIKSKLTTGTPNEKTTTARATQADIYSVKGYGNKLTTSTKLTVIDCSQFASGNELAQKFADALARGATGKAVGSDQFKSGMTWHPKVDFGRPCVYVCDGGVLSGTPMQAATVWVHLLEVDGSKKSVKCHVYHLHDT
jgi:hypothetical protein